MRSGRLEAFSDGVLAIVITIMVLELPKPDGATWAALYGDLPVLLAYLLSFVYVGIYWSNHHHLFQAATRVTGSVLWANLHLLFWLSLVPFATGWMSEDLAEASDLTELSTAPVVFYGLLLFAAGLAYWILARRLVRAGGPGSRIATAIGRDWKGLLSMVLYAAGILCSFALPVVGVAFYVAVALLWLVPDRRVERALAAEGVTD